MRLGGNEGVIRKVFIARLNDLYNQGRGNLSVVAPDRSGVGRGATLQVCTKDLGLLYRFFPSLHLFITLSISLQVGNGFEELLKK
ncbi:hypothetical protein PN499_07925 [Kamptonema animale CS-326]|jgi:hypothetical protein|uniref:hypothetical protein n=1 Tax=Kamptonema animale TaxID=92934 RepID=UPI00232D9CBE|nr:hypothetical protein [Kamptonema animale]MDB9511106.1 hypothetical protein [Kamptonema animale CS-326]